LLVPRHNFCTLTESMAEALSTLLGEAENLSVMVAALATNELVA
jgi:hypothetical protein